MSQDFDGFRGRGRGFGGGGGFRGGDRDFRGFRGGEDRGMSRGGFRGDFGSPRGFQGGDRSVFRGGNRGGNFGIRGGFGKRNGGGDYSESSRGFRGGGGFRVGRGGGFRVGRGGGFRVDRGGELRDRGGDTNLAVKKPVFKEIQDGLQLLVITKKTPTLEETKRQLPNFHSRIRRPTGKDSTSTAHVLLFTDLESLEAAKVKLDENPNVEATDYMGMKSAKKRAEATENRQLFMEFGGSPDEDSVKELDRRIESIDFLKSKTECWWPTTKSWESTTEPLNSTAESTNSTAEPLMSTAEPLKSTTLLAQFPSLKAATSAIKPLMSKIGTNGLRYVRESFGMKYQAAALAGIQRNQVVLRDVPKTTTLKDITDLFPDATRFDLYNKTFTASEYCHASLRFKENKRAAEILAKKEMEILGKKVYVVPAHSSLLQDFMELDNIMPVEAKAVAEIVEEAPMRMTKKNVTKRKKKEKKKMWMTEKKVAKEDAVDE